MTTIYRAIARPLRADFYGDDPVIEGKTVYEPDGSPINTGILDHNGIAIYRCHAPNPIGFKLK